MRIFKLDAQKTMILYRVLLKGSGGKGYSIDTLRLITPIMEIIESNFKKTEDTAIVQLHTECTVEFSIEENIFDILTKLIRSSVGWSAGKMDRTILDLDDFWKTIPTTCVSNDVK